MSAPRLHTFPLAICAACRSVGCDRLQAGHHFCDGTCQAAGPRPIPKERSMAARTPRQPFVVGDIETIAQVPVQPRTPSEHVAAALGRLEPGQTIAFAGISRATVRRVAKEWLDEYQRASTFDPNKAAPDLRVDFDADGDRVRVWRR